MKLVSAAGTGYFYAARKTKLFGKEKMILRKYDPRGTLHEMHTKPLCYNCFICSETTCPLHRIWKSITVYMYDNFNKNECTQIIEII